MSSVVSAPAVSRTPEGLHLDTPVSDVVRMGVVGFGYWGPNIVRNLNALDRCQLVSVCDTNANALTRARKTYPALHLTTDVAEVMQSPDIDAVALVTPVWTHFDLARAALDN